MNGKRLIRWTVLIVVTGIVVLGAAAYLVVHTRTFDRFLLAKLVDAAEARTGEPVEIKGIQIHWTQLGADLYGVKVFGRGGRAQPPLFETARLKVDLEIAPLLSGKIHLSELVLDRPIIHFRVNDRGESNLPGPSSPGKSTVPVRTIFELAARHIAVRSGQIYYNDAKIPLSADLADLSTDVAFNASSDQYQGAIGYASGQITYDHFRPFAHSAQLHFTADRSGMRLRPLTVATAHSHITLHAELTDYANPRVTGTYDTLVSTQDLARVMRTSTIPAGEVASTGTIGYRHHPGQSVLRSLRLAGRLSSPLLALRLRKFSAPLKSLMGAYALEAGVLRVASLQGSLLGGQIRVQEGAIGLTGQSTSHLSATVRNVSLPALSDAFPAGPVQRLTLAGRADLNAQVSWSGHFRNLIVQSRVNVSSQRSVRQTSAEIPLRGVMQVTYREAQDEASFAHSHLRIGSTDVSLDGVLSKRSNLNLKLSTGSLQELAGLTEEVAATASPKGSPAFQFPSVNGRAQFNGRMSGSPTRPELTGHVSATQVQIDSTAWNSIQADLDASPSQLALKNVVLLSKRKGRIELNAMAGLRDWSFPPSSPVSIRANAANLRVSDLQELANANYPVRGIVSASISVQGTRQNPSGQGSLRIANASAWGQPIELVTVDVHGEQSSVQATATLRFAAGVVTGMGTYSPPSRQYQIEMHVSGVKLGDIHRSKGQNWPVSGTLGGSANGRGSLNHPELSATLAVPQLGVGSQTVSNLRAKLDLSDRQLHFQANGASEEGTLQASGNVALTGPFNATATVDLHGLSVGNLIAHSVPGVQAGLEGKADIHADLRGPLKDPARLTMQAEIPMLSLRYQTVQVGLVRPLRLEYRDGTIAIQNTEIKGTGINLALQGTVPIVPAAPLNIAAKGTVNLSLLQAITTGVRSSGQLTVDVTAHGKLTEPTMQGNLRLENASLSSASLPVSLNRVNGQLRVSGNRIEISSLQGTVGGGSMSAQGAVTVSAHSRFHLAVQAQSVELNYPPGLRTRLGCELQFNGTALHSALTGRVIIDYLGFGENYDVATLASQFSSGPTLTTPSAFEKGMKLDVAVQSASTLNARSSQVSVQGAANLLLTGTLSDPVVLGRATLTGGEIFFFGKRYEIQSGNVQFSNPVRTTPSMNLYATTTIDQYTVSLHFLGPVDQMKTTFTSDPPLPPADIINLLAFGKTSEQAGGSSAPPSVLGAESLLAQGVAGQISGKLQRLAGISQLSITPIIGSTNQAPGAQVAIQQRVTGRLLVTITANTAQTQSTAVQVQYQLGHGLSVSTLRDQNGGYGVDVHFHKSF